MLNGVHFFLGYRKDKIVWMDYLKACRLKNAPKKLFRNVSPVSIVFFPVNLTLPQA